MLETELGFRLANDVGAPVSVENVLHNIATCHPMIELAAPNLAGPVNGVDLIATNAASYAYIQGDGLDCANVAIDSLEISFSHDGENLHTASSGTVMESQAAALTWLINHRLGLGDALRAGTLLMTGAIGAPHPGKPGIYRAEYGTLGAIEFTIA